MSLRGLTAEMSFMSKRSPLSSTIGVEPLAPGGPLMVIAAHGRLVHEVEFGSDLGFHLLQFGIGFLEILLQFLRILFVD